MNITTTKFSTITEVSEHRNIDVMRLQQIETPFYAKAVKSKLRLSDVAKEKIGIFDESEYVAPICNDVTSEYKFWGSLCKWSLKNDVVKPQQIKNLLSTPLNQQDEQGLTLINDVMFAINNEVNAITTTTTALFSDIRSNLDLKRWYNEDDADWGMTVQFLTSGEFGCDADENGEENDGMAIRLLSASFVGSVPFDIHLLPLNISNVLYNLLTDLSSVSLKASTFEMMTEYGVMAWDLADYGDEIITDFAKEIKKENLHEFSEILKQRDIADIKSKLKELAPNAMRSYEADIHDELPLMSLLAYYEATQCLSLYVRKAQYNKLPTRNMLSAYIKEINHILRVDAWKLDSEIKDKLKLIIVVVNRIIDNYDSSIDGNGDAWITGSSLSFYESNFISFGTDTENYFLDNMQDNLQSCGEEICLKLNLSSDQDYRPLLRNVSLIDNGLIALAQIINQHL